MLDFILTAVFIMVFVYLFVKFSLEFKFALTVDNYFDSIPLHEETNVPFHWSGHKTTLDDFDYFEQYTKIPNKEIKQSVKNDRTFELRYDNDERNTIQRQCFDGYSVTDGFGCVSDNINSCKGKDRGEFVADNKSRYEIHECDGNGGILQTHTCYRIHDYTLSFPCGLLNPCFNKDDGINMKSSKTLETYKYVTCKNGILHEMECEDRFSQFFDDNLRRCEYAPYECTQLEPYKTTIVNHVFCYNDGKGLSVLPVTPSDTIVECDHETSVDRQRTVPKLWTVSNDYLKCVKGYWNVEFCKEDAKQNNNRSELLREVREMPDGIMFQIPDLGSIQVFDPEYGKCVPFDYRKHYRNSKIPLILTHPLLPPSVNLLFEYDLNSKSKQLLDEQSNKILNSAFNDYVEIPQNLLIEHRFGDEEKQKCIDRFNNDLTIYSVAYRNVILSCFYKIPIHKEVVSENDNPSIWGRKALNTRSYKLASGETVRCPQNKAVHTYINTCVHTSCPRIDFPLPKTYPDIYPTFGTNYKHSNFVMCKRSGTYVYSNLIKKSFKNLLKRYCNGSTDVLIHPMYNIPIDCSPTAEVFIINDKSYRDYRQTFHIETDSIFLNDRGALDLMFIPGEDK